MRLINRSKGTFVVLLGTLALSVLAPGCGDDDDDTTVTTGGKSASGGKSNAGGGNSGGKTASGGSNSGGTNSGGSTSANGGTEEPAGGAGASSGGSHSGGNGSGGRTATSEGGAAGSVSEGGSAGSLNQEGGAAGSMNPAGGSGGAEAGAGGEGGGVTTPPRVDIATFDNGIAGWSTSVIANNPPNPNPAPTPVDAASTVEGHDATGAFQSVITFTGYGNADDQYGGETTASGHAFTTAVDWTGKTKLHAWVKVTVPGGVGSNDYLALFGWQLAVNSGTNKFYSQFHVPYTDQLWHEFVIDLAAGTADNYDPTQVKGVTVLLATTNVRATNAPVVPPVTTLLIDDVWVE